MMNDSRHVSTNIRYGFTLPRFDWDEMRTQYKTWVHIEDDPHLKCFEQQGPHMTPDLLTAMEGTFKSQVECQQREAQEAMRQVQFKKELLGDTITNRLKKALKDSAQSRRRDYASFKQSVQKFVREMEAVQLRLEALEQDINAKCVRTTPHYLNLEGEVA